jgi:hypothetical protein
MTALGVAWLVTKLGTALPASSSGVGGRGAVTVTLGRSWGELAVTSVFAGELSSANTETTNSVDRGERHERTRTSAMKTFNWLSLVLIIAFIAIAEPAQAQVPSSNDTSTTDGNNTGMRKFLKANIAGSVRKHMPIKSR